MYDPITRELIGNVPPLTGLDLARLPDDLASLYLDVVELRLAAAQDVAKNEIDARLDRLVRLGMTYASMVAADVTGEHSQAAAFVAGSAFHLTAQLAGRTGEKRLPLLSAMSVSPVIVATILFMIAEYPSDAQSVAAAIDISEHVDNPADVLAASVLKLGTGEIGIATKLASDVTRLRDSRSENSNDYYDRSLDAIWTRCADGLRALCAQLLGDISSLETSDPREIFRQVRDLAHEPLSLSAHMGDINAPSLFAGPHFLASLLLRLADTLPQQAVVGVRPPGSIDPSAWSDFLIRLAERRPYIWRNHREPIEDGFLEPGVSAAIGFPTGAGKSTLAELRVAAAVFSGQKVVFLAPTHALVNQTVRQMQNTLPDYEVRDSLITDGYYAEVEPDTTSGLADITVMTPERCLMLNELFPEHFAEVGLLIIDECHILHPNRGATDRRSIDSTLCLLRLMNNASDIDVVLLSAMMSNTDEIAEWLGEVLGRKCLSLKINWKPTRQARGALVFDSSEYRAHQLHVRQQREAFPDMQNLKASEKRKLTVDALALFCLQQHWHSDETEDYKLCRLMDVKLALGCEKWAIKANKNDNAAKLASELAKSGYKVIVFMNNKQHCQTNAEKIARMIPPEFKKELSKQERELLDAAITEVGDSDAVYTGFGGRACCHHSLLIPAERDLVEGLFRRENGVRVIVATPTLAQGINLPADIVLLVGLERFDQVTQRSMAIEAHQTLNAAGRAGRAGQRSEGIVIAIPDQPVTIDYEDHEVDRRAAAPLRTLFQQADQCLAIGDPIELLLDSLQSTNEFPDYLVSRIPLIDGTDGKVSDELAKAIFRRSLARYRAKKKGDIDSFDQAVLALINRRKEALLDGHTLTTIDKVATSNGVAVEMLVVIRDRLPSRDDIVGMTVGGWLNWLLGILKEDDQLFAYIVKSIETDTLLSPNQRKKHHTERRGLLLAAIESQSRAWIEGDTLTSMESKLDDSSKPYCSRARQNSQGLMLSLSLVLGWIPQVWRCEADEEGPAAVGMPLSMATASACIRRGFTSPEQLAFASVLPHMGLDYATTPRVRIHSHFADIEPFLIGGPADETFEHTIARVKRAIDEYVVSQ